MPMEETNIIIYNTADGRTSVSLLAKDGQVWMNQQQLAELFDTSKPNISLHITNILKENELDVKFSCQGLLNNCSRWQNL